VVQRGGRYHSNSASSATTGRNVLPGLQVVWLDNVAARARYGRWLGGVLPEFVPFPKTGKARGGSKRAGAAAAAKSEGTLEGGGGGGGSDGEEEGRYLNLRRLRLVMLWHALHAVPLMCCAALCPGRVCRRWRAAWVERIGRAQKGQAKSGCLRVRSRLDAVLWCQLLAKQQQGRFSAWALQASASLMQAAAAAQAPPPGQGAAGDGPGSRFPF
jgi:hypothetical protein